MLWLSTKWNHQIVDALQLYRPNQIQVRVIYWVKERGIHTRINGIKKFNAKKTITIYTLDLLFNYSNLLCQFFSSYKNWIKLFSTVRNFKAIFRHCWTICFSFVFYLFCFLYHILHETQCAKCLSGVVGGSWEISSETNKKMCSFECCLSIWIMVCVMVAAWTVFSLTLSLDARRSIRSIDYSRLQYNAVLWISLHLYVIKKSSKQRPNERKQNAVQKTAYLETKTWAVW